MKLKMFHIYSFLLLTWSSFLLPQEEEKGIEMTDDFGGKLQDIEKKQDEDGNEDESDVEEEEPDKEMGDTEKGAETLDQQVYHIVNCLKLNKQIVLDI